MNNLIDLTIFYCFAIEDDDPMKASFFQGFSEGLFELNWAMQSLIHLPASLIEPSLLHKTVLASRISGAGGWRWFPLPIREINKVEIAENAPFWVIFSGSKSVSVEISEWISTQKISPLHVTTENIFGAIKPEDLNAELVLTHAHKTLDSVMQINSTLKTELTKEQLITRKERTKKQADFPKWGHFCTLPNHMTLESAGIEFNEGERFFRKTEQEYIDVIRESLGAVLDLRKSVGMVIGFRVMPPQPGLIIMLPSLHRNIYQKLRKPSENTFSDSKEMLAVIKMLQKQAGFLTHMEDGKFKKIIESKKAKEIMFLRRREVEINTMVVGLRGASTLAATLRLPPAVNRTAPAFQKLADNARGQNTQKRKKFIKLFSQAQTKLVESVGQGFIDEIRNYEGGIKLISDVPLEWLPVGDLPMGIQYNVSRITSTPGNLLTRQLINPGLIRMKPEDFKEILMVSSFDADDPIRHLMPKALDEIDKLWGKKLKINIVEVKSLSAFKQAINDYQGAILIFDGHGNHDARKGFGTLRVGSDDIDVWSLHGEVRVPPIVILSACDTHAIDRSHATTANGFLMLGARAVLGSFLPVQAKNSAILIGRFLHRLAEFLPLALKVHERAITWSEVVSGMLRMQLLTDLLKELTVAGYLTDEKRIQINGFGNYEINIGNFEWYDEIINAVSLETPLGPQEIRSIFRKVIPLSDSIRYISMGNPETILIDDPSLSGTDKISS